MKIEELRLNNLAGTFQFVTKQENADVFKKFVENPQVNLLSQASLEVLAIIAYKQPITRVEIEDITWCKN